MSDRLVEASHKLRKEIAQTVQGWKQVTAQGGSVSGPELIDDIRLCAADNGRPDLAKAIPGGSVSDALSYISADLSLTLRSAGFRGPILEPAGLAV